MPAELIAQTPIAPRDASRLLVLDRARGTLEHARFREIGRHLRPADCLVLNNARVIPARFFCRRASGGQVEALFLHASAEGWQVLLRPSGRLRVGEALACEHCDTRLELCEALPRGQWRVRPLPEIDALMLLAQIGHTPLPPYIQRSADTDERLDRARYQTVYAARDGAVAAPTAGLHFTPELLAQLADGGVQRVELTLQVGLGTFQPIDVDELGQHQMHAEAYDVSPAAWQQISATRGDGGRIVAVGTTSVRVLETLPEIVRAKPAPGSRAARATAPRPPGAALAGWTSLFIYPGYTFRNVDMLLTNFHLPGSTLLALVMAFAGVDATRAAYQAAIAQRYRFYSYGDAMLIV